VDLLDTQPGRIGEASVVDGDPDVQLGEGYFKTHVGEHGHSLSEILGDSSTDKMTLETDSVEWDTSIKEGSSELGMNHGFVVHGLDIIIVDIKLDVGSGFVSVFELLHKRPSYVMTLADLVTLTYSKPHKVFTEEVVEYTVSESTVIEDG
jgi:hypothetical protein